MTKQSITLYIVGNREKLLEKELQSLENYQTWEYDKLSLR